MTEALMIDRADYLYFAERALDGMTGIVVELGDDLANRRPPLPGANSPYALLMHCLGVVDFWSGHLVGGRVVDRDRQAEFLATGSVASLAARVADAKTRLSQDVSTAAPSAPVRARPPAEFLGPPRDHTQGSALQHAYEELAQHHGQMEIIRDVILAGQRGDLVAGR